MTPSVKKSSISSKTSREKPISGETPQLVHIHTTLPSDVAALLTKLSKKYGSQKETLIEAIKLLYTKTAITDRDFVTSIDKSMLHDRIHLALFMLMDFKMVLVGRRTFLSYIKTLPTAPIQENNAIELIEWYYNNIQTAGALSLYQVLDAIRELWLAGQYFESIVLQPLDSPSPGSSSRFKMTFTHSPMFDKLYGEYWTTYFQTVLTLLPIQATVRDVTINNQSFHLEICKDRSGGC